MSEDEGVTSTTAAALERTIVRYGDDLYRLALLLAADTASAARALLLATRRLAASDAAVDEYVLIAALLAALPPERRWRPRRTPGWARPSSRSAAPLLKAITRLPRRQRLVLGLALLRGAEPEQIASFLEIDETEARGRLRDTLLALTPQAAPDLAPADLDWVDAPEACRPTRAALALYAAALQVDPAIRGHLALCSACRAAEQAWLELTKAVEAALCGALRDVRLPADLAAQLRGAAAQLPVADQGLLSNLRLRLVLVALPVLALIAFLILPRGARIAAPSAALDAQPSDVAPRDLVQRALATLYAPPAGDGVWHSRYTIQWNFADNTHAPLNAEQWVEPATGRHRVQLVHAQGGGPYELELADGARSAWYAVGPSYAPSLYPLSFDPSEPRVRLRATPDAQQQLLRARLQSGAWDLAAAYLRQAQAAPELHPWGRQHSADGAVVALISFAAASPLALPPDAPGAADGQITIMLTIEAASGRLREVRELVGPPGGEQLARTTWRFESEEWITDSVKASRLFDVQQAWNGVGQFVEHGQLADPALPLVRPSMVTSLASSFQQTSPGMWMPSRPPPGANAALLLDQGMGSAEIRDGTYASPRLTFVYIGAGRRLELSTSYKADRSAGLAGGEVRMLNGQQLVLLAAAPQRYQAEITHKSLFDTSLTLVTRMGAWGYSRAELLDILGTLGPPTLDGYRAQARLFADPHPHDGAFDALLGALTLRDAPAGSARHLVEHVFTRHDGAGDPLADPYHRPRYDGFPEQVVQETWVRSAQASDMRELASSMYNVDGALYLRQYISADAGWLYRAPTNEIYRFAGSTNYLDTWNTRYQTILQMLACGGGELLANADGTRTVFFSESSWRTGACLYPLYPDFFRAQTTGAPDWAIDGAPYLADVQDEAITTWLDLDAAGRPLRLQVRAGSTRAGTLLESWELARDEQVPTAEVPASTFDPAPPDALLHWHNLEGPTDGLPQPRRVTITEALELVRTPLFGLPDRADPARAGRTAAGAEFSATLPLSATLLSIEGGAPPDLAGIHWFSEGETAFDRALRDDYAVRLTYTLRQKEEVQSVRLYEGPAQTFGAYLRALAHWTSSAPITLQLGGEQIDGWQVAVDQGSHSWTLFEREGTLIAVELPFADTPLVVGELERIAKP